MIKRITAISLIIVIAIAILFGAYFLIRKAIQVITGPVTGEPTASLSTPPVKLKMLGDEPAFDYWIAQGEAGTSEIFYLTPNGAIVKATENKDEIIASQPIDNLQSIRPSHDGSLVLVRFGNSLAPQFSILNSRERSWQPLPLNVRAADFSPDLKQIALLVSANGKDDLIIQDLNPDPKSKSRKLLSIYQRGLILNWLNTETILLVEQPSDLAASSIWAVNIKDGTIKTLSGDVFGLAVQWSKDGQVGVRYTNTGGNPSIDVINASGESLGQLGDTTIPEKCAVDEQQIFCAIPSATTLSSSQQLLDQYLRKAIFSSDRINFYDGRADGYFLTKTVFDGNPAMDITRLTKNNNSIVFINRLDQKLYQLEL